MLLLELVRVCVSEIWGEERCAAVFGSSSLVQSLILYSSCIIYLAAQCVCLCRCVYVL